MSLPPAPTPDWPLQIHAALTEADVRLVGYVPDAGHKRLIELCHQDPAIRALPLTSEEEGIGLAAGAWLGGARSVVLMQSSGVGNLPNALAMARSCRFPLVVLVTMRGEEGETNPWQVPMGRCSAAVLGALGVEVTRADTPRRRRALRAVRAAARLRGGGRRGGAHRAAGHRREALHGGPVMSPRCTAGGGGRRCWRTAASCWWWPASAPPPGIVRPPATIR